MFNPIFLQIAPPGGDSSSEDESAAAAAAASTTEAVVHNNRQLRPPRPMPGVDFFSDDEDRKVTPDFGAFCGETYTHTHIVSVLEGELANFG